MRDHEDLSALEAFILELLLEGDQSAEEVARELDAYRREDSRAAPGWPAEVRAFLDATPGAADALDDIAIRDLDLDHRPGCVAEPYATRSGFHATTSTASASNVAG